MRIVMRRLGRQSRPRVEPLEGRELLSVAGSLDASFGSDLGFTTFKVGSTTSQASGNGASVSGVAVQSNGKIVIAGKVSVGSGDPLHPSGPVSFLVERLNLDGTPDTTFGTNGLFTTVVSDDGNANSSSVLIQPNGDIIEVGYSDLYFGGTATEKQSFVAIRLLSNGTLDSNFGTAGVASYPSASFGATGSLTSVTAAALQSNGQIVLVGSDVPFNSNTYAMTAVRLNTDGSLDTGFGTTGTVNIPVTVGGTSVSASAVGVAIQSGGQIVVAGSSIASDAVAARLQSNGTVDTTFGTSGQVVIPTPPGSVSGVHLNISSAVKQSDDKIILSGDTFVSGSSATTPSLVRLDANGTVDTTFGQSGYDTPAVSGTVTVQSDGKIVVAGGFTIPPVVSNITVTPRSQFASLRLQSDGSADSTYGNTSTPGLARYSFGASSVVSTPTAVAIDPTDGNIVLAGTASLVTYPFFIPPLAVARVLATASTSSVAASPPSPTPPAALSGSGLTNLAVYLPTSGEFAYRTITGSNVNTDLFDPFGSAGLNQTIPAAADYFGLGQSQVAAYLTAGGVYAIQPIAGVSAGLYLQFGTAGVGQTIPVPADYEGTGKDDVAVYLTASGTFAILPSSGAAGYEAQFGAMGMGQSIPAPADYFGTGKADIAVYLAASGSFAIRPPGGGADIIGQFGMPGLGKSIPVPGDYDGSGKVELAVYIPSLGEFIYRPANGGPDVTVPFGTPGMGELPVPGDYDGSGHDEFAVYDPTRGFFAYHPASGGNDVLINFGSANGGSIPVAAPSGSLSVFTTSSGSGTGAFWPLAVPPTSSSSTSSIVTTRSSTTVPAGPTLASIRVTRSLINQGSTVSSKFIP